MESQALKAKSPNLKSFPGGVQILLIASINDVVSPVFPTQFVKQNLFKMCTLNIHVRFVLLCYRDVFSLGFGPFR